MQPQYAPSVRWEWISEAWSLFTKQWTVWSPMILIAGLAYFLAIMVIYVPIFGMAMVASSIPQDGDISASPAFPIGLLLLYPVIFLVIASVMAWLGGGLYNTAFKQVRGEQIAISDLFSGGKYFVRILGAIFLIWIAVGIGSIFLVIPGLIVAGLLFLTIPMIVEGGKGTIDAIKSSIEVTKHDWIMFTIFAFALGFLATVGIYACGIGALATMPLLFLGHALAYRDCVGVGAARRQEQFMPPPAPDYRTYTTPETEAYAPSPQQQSWSAQPPQAPPPQPAQPWAAPTFLNQPAEPEPAPPTCPHCGATLARVMNFCNQCGRPLHG